MGNSKSSEKIEISMRKFTYELSGKTCQKSSFIKNKDSSDVKNLSYDNKKWLKEANPIPQEKPNYSWLNKEESVKKSVQTFGPNDYEQISTTIKDTDYTHTGLVQYLAIAWADEKGIILRPDMFHHLISCEIAKNVIEYPDSFRSLYTKSDTKKDITIVTIGNDIEFIELLDKELENNVIDKEFKKLLSDTKFKSEPESYSIVKKICFSNSATPYYNYMRTLCGYPSISVPDVLEDWILLYDFIVKIGLIIKKQTKESNAVYNLINYLIRCAKHIKEIIDIYFDNDKLKEKLQKIFYIEDDTKCGSGHDSPYNVFGWITDFYLGHYSILSEYPASLPYLPYKFIDRGNYAIVTGLITSSINNNVLNADYAKIELKIKNQKLFDIIKN